MANLSCIPKYVKKEITDGWTGEVWYLMLLNNSFTPKPATQHYVSDVVAYEITDSGTPGAYKAGGILMNGLSSNADGNNYFLDAQDVSIGPNSSIDYRYGAFYTTTGGTGQSTYKLRAIIDFLTDQVVNNGTSLIQWNALGIIYLT
jgi:hypothetical protein